MFFFFRNKNPYDDVIWVEDCPGVSSRFVNFTPFLKSNPKIRIGNTSFGADYGRMIFEDIDNDGIKETIIETKQPFYIFDDAVSPTKIVLKYEKDADNQPKFIIVKEENLLK